ncbi:hypothetical protein Zmor_017559 [Zophobas morio]|uniref:Uncharacterized protein n=1 Tax=Zophobas morio TaxID=2755281 RepID=A0AA38I8L9_9CUCU|nr:hypothetical protein Zmor_017559 [Zophobas morio]
MTFRGIDGNRKDVIEKSQILLIITCMYGKICDEIPDDGTVRNLTDNVWGGGVLGCQALGRLVSLISETRLVDQAYAATFTPPGWRLRSGATVARAPARSPGEGAPGCSKAGDTEFR